MFSEHCSHHSLIQLKQCEHFNLNVEIPFKSHWKEVFKTPLTLVKAIILAHLMALQSSGIFKMLTKSLNYVIF